VSSGHVNSGNKRRGISQGVIVGRGKNEDDRVFWERKGVRKKVAGQIVRGELIR
jgi:hypothetical protein